MKDRSLELSKILSLQSEFMTYIKHRTAFINQIMLKMSSKTEHLKKRPLGTAQTRLEIIGMENKRQKGNNTAFF